MEISAAEDDLYFSSITENVDLPSGTSFRMVRKDGVGRCLVATRDIQPGEVIFRERCLVEGPLHCTVPVCMECYTKGIGVSRCEYCGLPLCRECSSKPEDGLDSLLHTRLECSVFRSARRKFDISEGSKEDPVYQCMAPLRCLLMRDEPKSWKIIQGMESHIKNRQGQEHWNVCQVNIVQYLLEYWKLDFSQHDVNHAIGVLEVNSFQVEGRGVGRGIFPLLSLLSHSCVSNVKYVYCEDRYMECIATVEIKGGEEMQDHYVSNLDSSATRISNLRSGWYFHCQCARCKDPSELGTFIGAVLCRFVNGGCTNGLLLPHISSHSTVYKCDSCEAVVEDMKARLQPLQTILQEAKSADTDLLEGYLQKCLLSLHPTHSIVIELKRHLICRYNSRRERQDVVTAWVKQMLAVFDKICPGLTKERGVLIYQGFYAKYMDNILDGRLVTQEIVDDRDKHTLQEAFRCLEREKVGTFEHRVKAQVEKLLESLS